MTVWFTKRSPKPWIMLGVKEGKGGDKSWVDLWFGWKQK